MFDGSDKEEELENVRPQSLLTATKSSFTDTRVVDVTTCRDLIH